LTQDVLDSEDFSDVGLRKLGRTALLSYPGTVRSASRRAKIVFTRPRPQTDSVRKRNTLLQEMRTGAI